MELKKNPNLDLEKRRPLFFYVGLVSALSFVIVAFEWRHEIDPIEVLPNTDIFDQPYLPPITDIPLPPKPVLLKEKVEVIKSNQQLNLVPTIDDFDPQIFSDPAPAIDDQIPYFEPDPEPVPITFIVSEIMPSFPGGQSAFNEYLSNELKFPSRAINRGLGGKVFLSFVIDEDGSVTDVQVLKGAIEECDKEAIRVLLNSPKWNPGRQRGVPVRVRQSIMIDFRLN